MREIEDPEDRSPSQTHSSGTVLRIEDVSSQYGPVKALHGVSIMVSGTGITSVLGRNGAGKSTLCRCIVRQKDYSGRIEWDGADLSKLQPWSIAAAGIGYSPEGSKVLPSLTVEENLKVGGYVRRRDDDLDEAFERIYSLFPALRALKNQRAGTLSGGESQMVAIGRALMCAPSLLVLDEPSFGLAPSLIQSLFETISSIPSSGTAVLIAEQNPEAALGVSDQTYVLESGTLVFAGTAEEAFDEPRVEKALYV